MKKMFKLFKFVFVVAFIFGGWALAAASLHVVRAPGSMFWNKVPVNVQLVPKNSLSFKGIYIDTTKWQQADLNAHPALLERLCPANKQSVIDQVRNSPAPSQAQATTTPPVSSTLTLQKHAVDPSAAPAASPDITVSPSYLAPSAPEKPKEKSIFDFGK
jgi:hypothetical protein